MDNIENYEIIIIHKPEHSVIEGKPETPCDPVILWSAIDKSIYINLCKSFKVQMNSRNRNVGNRNSRDKLD